MNKNTPKEKDFIASRIVRELPDAYDKIIDMDMVKSIEEAVFYSAPDIFERNLSGIEVTKISDEEVDFKFGSWNFEIGRNGIIKEVNDFGIYAKAELDPIFTDALNLGLHQVSVSIEAEKRVNPQNTVDALINDAKSNLDTNAKSDMLPSDLIL